jgi:peptide/nickel transport system permease protein
MYLLLTDKCFLAVLLISALFILFSARKKHIRAAFRRILQKPLAISAGIILLFFLVLGILDSIHLDSSVMKNTASGQNDSILDKILSPLGAFYEKTYSAPLALKLYAVEIQFINGKTRQVYPRLEYVNPNIKNSLDERLLIKKNIARALLVSGLLTLISWLLILLLKGLFGQKLTFLPNAAGTSALLTFFLCLFAAFASYWLSRYFHLFGTGKIGQDIFYYAVKSIRTGLVIGILTTLFMFPLALFLGIAAGYFGGLIDDVIQYLYTTISSIPGVLLITASVLSMQTYLANHPEKFPTLSASADARLFALCLILGVTSWTSLCRLLRAETLKLREVDYVTAGRALGSRSFTIIRKHLIPNVMHIVLITLVLDFSFLVLAEAVLSYVGVGVSPTTISWGNMINSARLELARDPIVWWPMMSAFVFMFVLVLASNLFADAIRDVFDPHQANF